MAETTAPLLDINTQIARQTVRIDGTPYEMRGQRDLVMSEYQSITRFAPRLGELMTAAGSGTLKKAHEAELGELLDECMRMALIASPSVHKRLSQVEKSMVAVCFLEPLGPMLLRLIPRRLVTRFQAGTKSSPASRGSTAARQTSGGRKSRAAR